MKSLFTLGGVFKIHVYLCLFWFTNVICNILTMNIKQKDFLQAKIIPPLSRFLLVFTMQYQMQILEIMAKMINDLNDT